MPGARGGAGGLLLLALVVASPGGAAGEPHALQRLREQLVSSGRAEVGVTQVVTMEGDTVRQLRGRLVLEMPDRVRVDDTITGERLTARGDGGEWLQPAAEQMLVLRPEQAAQVAGAWHVLLESSRLVQQRAAGSGRFILRARAGAEIGADSLWVRLGADGLPAEVRAFAGAEQWRLTFGTWKFRKARGASEFRLEAPAGYAVIEWP